MATMKDSKEHRRRLRHIKKYIDAARDLEARYLAVIEARKKRRMENVPTKLE